MKVDGPTTAKCYGANFIHCIEGDINVVNVVLGWPGS